MKNKPIAKRPKSNRFYENGTFTETSIEDGMPIDENGDPIENPDHIVGFFKTETQYDEKTKTELTYIPESYIYNRE